MSLAALPLVLVQDILEFVVLGTWTCEVKDLLALRLVNRLFEREITKFFARTLMQGSVKHSHHEIVDRIPHDFQMRLLMEYIGIDDRRKTFFASKMHAVVEYLFENLQPPMKPPAKYEMLRKVCEALIIGRYHYEIFYNPLPQLQNKGFRPGKGPMHRTAFLIAIILQYDELQVTMLNSVVRADYVCDKLGRPIEQAIKLGHKESTRLLIEYGANLSSTDEIQYELIKALKFAARQGYTEIILLVLEKWRDSDLAHLDAVYEIVRAANRHGQKNTAGRVMWAFISTRIEGMDYRIRNYFLHLAARSGDMNLVRKVFDLAYPHGDHYNEAFRGVFSHVPIGKNHPLNCAARSGDFDTCEFLFQKAYSPYGEHRNLEGPDLLDIHKRLPKGLWKYAAIGGNVRIAELLTEYKVPKGADGLNVLSIAAMSGNLAMAQYAVKHRLDKTYQKKKDTMFHRSAHIRHFSFLRAIVAGRKNIVRWMIEDLHLDVNGSDCKYAKDRDLIPLQLAIDAGDYEMVELLLQLGAVRVRAANFEDATSAIGRDDRGSGFDAFRIDLDLGQENDWYNHAEQAAVEQAFRVAIGTDEEIDAHEERLFLKDLANL